MQPVIRKRMTRGRKQFEVSNFKLFTTENNIKMLFNCSIPLLY